jgi:hypothetical protein
MNQILLQILRLSAAGVGVSLVVGGNAIASEPASVNQSPTESVEIMQAKDPVILPTDPETVSINDIEPEDTLGQINNVSQLRDIQPGDWAYEALRSLVERYGVIAGYPDGTFRGNRPMTRYEFAAGLNATLDQINQLLTGGKGSHVTRQDLSTVRQLQDEFTLELALLRGRVDAVTARTRELELTQFSTTTKLKGEVVVAAAGVATGETVNGNPINKVTTFGHRTRLNLDSSFTGRDLLRTRLQAEGLSSLSQTTTTPEGDLAFTGASDNQVKIDTLLYRFPVGDRTQVVVAGHGADARDITNTVNPYFDGDGDTGALSRFATRPPIYYQFEGAGVGIQHQFSDKIALSVGYLASNSGNSDSGAGLFNGPYSALAQVVFQPSPQASIGLTYVHAYNRDLQTGSTHANLVNQLGIPVVSNSYGLEASFQISPRLVLGGWAGYTSAEAIAQGDASIWNWAVTLALPDLGKKGNLAGIIIGMEPKVTREDSSLKHLGINDSATSLHLEAFYQYRLSDNIAITPGLIWLTAPDHSAANQSLLIGAVRTTFSF